MSLVSYSAYDVVQGPEAVLQAARFLEEGNHQRKVQLFFTIILTLLEHQLLTMKQKCTPSELAADPKIDVEAMFRRITNAVKVQYAHFVMHFAPDLAVKCQLCRAFSADAYCDYFT